MRVAYFGTWEQGYPRNEQVISSLRAAGVDVELIHANVWTSEHKFAPTLRTLPRLAIAEARLAATRRAAQVDALIVGYPGQLDIWAARRHGKPVIFNAMVSLYDAFVEDRRRFTPGSAPARALRSLDRFAFRSADLLVSDTAANAQAMAELADLARVEVCFVGAEERLFRPSWKPPTEFKALFVGKLIPLHGIDVILAAAKLAPEIEFRIIGSGQEEAQLAALPPNVEHVPWVDYRRLPEEYGAAGCALGIFSTNDKASRVIPNKVFQALACGTPIVTADTPAIRELLTSERDVLLVPAGDPNALAAAIARLRDTELAQQISAAGLETFRRSASEEVLGRQWKALLERAISAS